MPGVTAGDHGFRLVLAPVWHECRLRGGSSSGVRAASVLPTTPARMTCDHVRHDQPVRSPGHRQRVGDRQGGPATHFAGNVTHHRIAAGVSLQAGGIAWPSWR